jgi:ribosome-binding ATPase YchF (GTP1/OBG family)
MLVRLGCCLVIAVAMLVTVFAPHSARADCSEEISKLMSKDTEKLTTRFQRIVKQAEKGSSTKLIQEECKIARQLKPRLEDQLAALKQSGCLKDPQMGNMVADIVRGHEDDLAAANRSSARSECR